MYSMKQQRSMHCFLMLLITCPTLTWGSKPSTSCGKNGNADTVCSPAIGDTWQQNGTYYLTTWNPTYPTYVSSPSLSIYIYFVEHYQKINVMSYHNISNTGEYPILINDSWFDPVLNLHDSSPHDARLYLVSSDVNPVNEMNNLNSPWPQPVRLSILESTSSQSSPNSPPSTSNSKGVPHWVTPIIVIGCLLLLLGCLATLWMRRMIRRRKLVFDEKGHLEHLSAKSSTVYPMASSSEQLVKHADIDPHHHHPSSPPVSSSYPDLSPLTPPPPPTIQSMSNISSRSDPPLTSTDALLIADTFRQRMRRPEWPHCSTIVKSSSSISNEQTEAEANDAEAERKKKEEDEEIKRRIASELLLKKELEAEGTLMKKVGKRAHLLSTIQQDSPSNPPPPI
ncbi:hypothetical protein BCR42DRAFT_400206 [Absidia repens]|uniref:Uncharacterized protein n=1 Tax=Absidia repens TaxID=90262 RepID=A0A1X2J0X3_9FUNG|nr:hypothetical protein BCR42DRAFT_400206 [Absidia repens]